MPNKGEYVGLRREELPVLIKDQDLCGEKCARKGKEEKGKQEISRNQGCRAKQCGSKNHRPNDVNKSKRTEREN